MAAFTDAWACPACTLHNQPDESICGACSHAKPGSEEPPCDFAPMEAAVKALADASPSTVGLDEELPKRGTKSFAHLPNGDCMPHALALGTHYLLERRIQGNEQHVSLAAQMRSLLHAHMERHWYGSCMVTEGGLRWSQLVTRPLCERRFFAYGYSGVDWHGRRCWRSNSAEFARAFATELL